MHRAYFFCLLLSFATSSFAETVNFRIINTNASSADEAKIRDGIEFFKSIYNQHCGAEISGQITHQRVNPPAGFSFVNDSSWTLAQVGANASYWFRFFQKSMFDFNQTHRLSQRKNEVTIYLQQNLGSHCGFAFPDIQFTDAQARVKNPNAGINNSVVPWIRNRVIMAAPTQNGSDCANSNRMTAHELAHIFVQDESPHTCWDTELRRYQTCPEDNILATYRYVYDEPRFGRGRPPGPDLDEPQVRPATGTRLDQNQCQAIFNTIQNMNN